MFKTISTIEIYEGKTTNIEIISFVFFYLKRYFFYLLDYVISAHFFSRSVIRQIKIKMGMVL